MEEEALRNKSYINEEPTLYERDVVKLLNSKKSTDKKLLDMLRPANEGKKRKPR